MATAQAPAWQSARAVAVATAAATSTYSDVTATAVDAAGNVFLAGSFTGTVVLGGTILTSLGGFNVFVAKFNPTSNQFAWAQQAGGMGSGDEATALAISGNSVYVAGGFSSSTAAFGPVTLANTGGSDIFVAKLTDAGSTGGFVWAQAAGGTGTDRATALVVSGTSVYMTGYFDSSTASFGSTALTNVGSNDIFVAKLTDAGSTSSFTWAQRAGGTGFDVASQIAVSGTSVYVAGGYSNAAISFGSISLTNAGSFDVFVAKLTDAGSTGSFVWAQRAGSTNFDYANALVASGSSVYVAGGFSSPTVGFGNVVLTNAGAAGTTSDVFVTKLTDMGSTSSFVWAERAGGAGTDNAFALAVTRNSVYLAGEFDSSIATFGPTTLVNAGGYNIFVTKITDAVNTGSFAWAQQAGGPGSDRPVALALGGTSVYVVGYFDGPTATFGTTTLTNPTPNNNLGFLASLTDLTLSATAAALPREPAFLFPNPARARATLRRPAGAGAAALTLTDALGRTVRRYPAPAGPTDTALDLGGLPAGLYLLRGAGPALRLTVE